MELMHSSPSDTDWAYLAGLIDGEGCISASRNRARGGVTNSCRPLVRVSQKNRALLADMALIFGVGHLRGRRRPDKENREIWDWYVSNVPELRWLLEGCMPYLRLKKKEARIALRLCKYSVRTGPDALRLKKRLSELKGER